MARKKYFFFDYDGTLTAGSTGEITVAAGKALDMLAKNGHFVSVATGRLQCDAYERCAKVGIENLVSDGGNGLTINGKLIFQESINLEHSFKLLDELEQKEIAWAVTSENSIVRYSKSERFTREIKDTYMKTILRPELDYKELKQLYKIFISCDVDTEKEIQGLKMLPTVRYRSNCLFVEPDDKYYGIMKMLDYIKAPSEDVVVFGDGMNDLKMFRKEWTSIAMGNARDELKKKADFVTKNSDQDGIEFACRYFGWI